MERRIAAKEESAVNRVRIDKRRRGKERGFTLIEVLASIVLLMILVTVLLGFFTNGFQAITASGERSERMHTTRQTIEAATAGNDHILKVGTGNGAITIHGELVENLIDGTKGSYMTLFIPTPPPWEPDIHYTLNDQVRYNKETYKCIQPHISNAGNAPSNSTNTKMWVKV